MHYPIEQLIYDNHTLTTKKPIPLDISSSTHDIAIVLHIFYVDLWQEIHTYLKHIDIRFDLYISIPPHITEQEVISIFNDCPDIHIYRTKNQGRDVLPFLQIMHLIGTDRYRYVCKMHTKKTGESHLGNIWRRLLYYDLLGSAQTVKDIISTFENDPKVGILTGKNTLLDAQRYTYGNDEKIQTLCKDSGVIYEQHYLFPAGTMFWIRPEIITPILTLFKEEKLSFEEELGQKDNTLAHAIERFFGIVAQFQNKRIVESPALYKDLDETTLRDVSSLVLSQQYVGQDIFALQKRQIEDLNAAIEFKEEEVALLKKIAESMRIKNRIRNIGQKVIPLSKKVAKIPKKIIQLIKIIKNNPTLLKKVWHYAKRGELHYLLNKIREKSTTNLTHTEALEEVDLLKYFATLDTTKYILPKITIDIIIPVYNGYEFLEPLFDSIEAHTSTSYRLIVINDCSPDSKVKPYLEQRLQKHSSAIFIDHTHNQGFLKSVNEAYSYTSNHFVLLNTDTEVPSFWLERLMYPILHMDNIASTTPFTNSGEIASFPHFVADNPIFDGMSVESLDAHFKTVKTDDFYAEVPTGVGFCMGINYETSKKIGMFAEDTFGKGYGEENDWCQRAIQEGYKNLIVPNLFVYHKHGGSFCVEEKQKLLEKNAVTLLERHPNYGIDVNKYLARNPHKTLRHLLVLKASNSTHPIHLIFDHALGGGANLYTQERIEKYLKDDKNILLVKYDFYSHCYTLTHHYKTYCFHFKITSFEGLKSFINTLEITELFLNNFVSYKAPLSLLEYIHNLVEKSHANLIIPIHDFYAICPSYNLLNQQGKYCDVPDLETCKVCMQSNMQEWRNFYEEEVHIVPWRKTWTALLEKSHEILAFSDASKNTFLKAYPTIEDSIVVIPHEVNDIAALSMQKDPNKTTTTIGILGAINYVKGAEIIKQMVQIIERDALDINVVVIGEITETIHSTHFYSTGRYQREQLAHIIQTQQIDIFLIPSIWPETFSYTTQEIMMMGLPLMVFNLGAPAERVASYKKGIVLEEINAQCVLDNIKAL